MLLFVAHWLLHVVMLRVACCCLWHTVCCMLRCCVLHAAVCCTLSAACCDVAGLVHPRRPLQDAPHRHRRSRGGLSRAHGRCHLQQRCNDERCNRATLQHRNSAECNDATMQQRIDAAMQRCNRATLQQRMCDCNDANDATAQRRNTLSVVRRSLQLLTSRAARRVVSALAQRVKRGKSRGSRCRGPRRTAAARRAAVRASAVRP